MKLGTIPRKETTYEPRRMLVPPIGLERPEKKELAKDQQLTFKLRANPPQANSPTYDTTVPFYNTGTCEEWLTTLRAILRVAEGQNMTNGPARFALARRILQGDALSAFETAAATHNAETVDTCLESLQSVTAHVFPTDALTQQKRYMRRFMRKPMEMNVRSYVSRVTEINQWLSWFPTGFIPDQQIPQDVIREILEFSVPVRWQQQMIMQGFIPENKTIAQFVEFCERFERTDGMTNDNSPKRRKASGTSDDSRDKSRKNHGRNAQKKKKGDGSRPDFKPCPIHGRSHSEQNCWDLKRLKEEAQNRNKDKSSNFKKKKRPSEEANAIQARESTTGLIEKLVEERVAAAMKKAQLDNEIDAEINAAFNYDDPEEKAEEGEEEE